MCVAMFVGRNILLLSDELIRVVDFLNEKVASGEFNNIFFT